jgi:hypothetical protein
VTTKAILRARILDDLERDQTNDGTRIDNCIDDAIAFYQPKRFFFNESAGVALSTVAAQQTYTFSTPTTTGDITTEFYEIDGVYVTASGTVYDLDVQNYNDILSWTDTSTPSSRPTDWAYAARRLIFYPIPDAIYTMSLTGHIKVAKPANDAETDNPWMTEAFELIRSAAKRFYAAHILGDDAIAGRAQAMEKMALTSLMDATVDRVRTGYVSPSSDF